MHLAAQARGSAARQPRAPHRSNINAKPARVEAPLSIHLTMHTATHSTELMHQSDPGKVGRPLTVQAPAAPQFPIAPTNLLLHNHCKASCTHGCTCSKLAMACTQYRHAGEYRSPGPASLQPISVFVSLLALCMTCHARRESMQP